MQTTIEKLSKAEEKLDRMMAIASREHKRVTEEIARLKQEQESWFMAFHDIRVIGEIAREEGFDEMRLKHITERYAETSEKIGYAFIHSYLQGGRD